MLSKSDQKSTPPPQKEREQNMTVQYTALGFLTSGGYIFLDNISILNVVQLPSYWINFKDGNLRPHSLGSPGGHLVGVGGLSVSSNYTRLPPIPVMVSMMCR